MSNEDYHNDITAISKSGLDKLEYSPLEYYSHYLAPDRQVSKETPALLTGTATHCAIFEPLEFKKRFVCLKQAKDIGALELAEDYKAAAEKLGIKPGSLTKAKLKEKILEVAPETLFYEDYVVRETAGKKEITLLQYNNIMRMQEAVYNHSDISVILESGVAEQSFFFDHPEYGVKGKFRTDFIPNEFSIIVDLKTTDCARPKDFGKSAAFYRYDVAGAWYTDGMYFNSGQRPDCFLIIAVENNRPFHVVPYELTTREINTGRMKYEKNLKTYAECKKAGVWPGYTDSILPLQMPEFAYHTSF